MEATAIDSDKFDADEKFVLAMALLKHVELQIEPLREAYPKEIARILESRVGLLEAFLVANRGYWFWVSRWKQDVDAGKTEHVGTYLYIADEFLKWLQGKVFNAHECQATRTRGSHSGVNVPWTGQTRKPGSRRGPL